MPTLIGFDFSINKPAVCVFNDNKVLFASWPYNISKTVLSIYKTSPLRIFERKDDKQKGNNVSQILRYEVKNARYLAELIRNSLLPFLNEDTYIGFEGLSYASGGNSGLQLSGYKYVLMDVLSEHVSIFNMFTYSPLTIKKTAGCPKMNQTKNHMIEAFKLTNNEMAKYLMKNEELFKTKKGNWIVHLDDIVDSYYVMETLRMDLGFKGSIG